LFFLRNFFYLVELWNNTWTAFMEGHSTTSSDGQAKTKNTDRRFKSELWEINPYFNFMKQSYMQTATWILDRIQDTEDLDEHTKKKLIFFTQQYVDALSPSNFPFSNPDVLRETILTGGQNLVEGIENLVEDIEASDGRWALRTTDKSAFRLGDNIAQTKGSVVYENDLMQLIQYNPSTSKCFKTPLLIVPPWINKYYILDMREENSFVKWLVDQGHTVFMVSWVNPDQRHRKKSFASYMEEGIFAALNQIEKITQEKQTNVIGYCIGGTLLTCALAYLKKIKNDDRIKSATFLTTLVDFKDSGDLKVFIDEQQIELMEDMMAEKGYLDASYMKATFSLLRANDLIWSFVVNNYLMGKDPFPFDLLYWNDDSVNLPQSMHSFYLRNMYLKNNLIKPGKIKLKGVPIDITTIDTPAYFLSTREDHIAPWKATYETTQYFKGPKTFTLAASGHIAGVVNPPKAEKYCHWVSSNIKQTPDEWLEKAKLQDGSWWPNWQKWIEQYAGEKVTVRKPQKEIEPAPGRYVKGE
jgi:polyhydroxyalkanoate synthase